MFEKPKSPYKENYIGSVNAGFQIGVNATLKAVVKWLDEPCNDHLKGLGSPRRYCNGCLDELRKAAEEA